jgi:uncharacterized membrane protein YciS (DUF1049 family)
VSEDQESTLLALVLSLGFALGFVMVLVLGLAMYGEVMKRAMSQVILVRVL